MSITKIGDVTEILVKGDSRVSGGDTYGETKL